MSERQSRRWLILRLEAPLLSFGAVAIDHRGVTWDFPGLSMLTGLFANALGWDRTEGEAHQSLQDRIVFASRRESELYHGVLRDTQNVHLQKSDKGWTTRSVPEGRDGGSYGGPHRRLRDYHPDALVAVAVTLSEASGVSAAQPVRLPPTLDELARALDYPQRPLFIGRKPCLPACRLNTGFIEAETAYQALSKLPALADRQRHDETLPLLRAQWPAGEGPPAGQLVDRGLALADRRNWISGLHGGTRHVIEGRVHPAEPNREAVP